MGLHFENDTHDSNAFTTTQKRPVTVEIQQQFPAIATVVWRGQVFENKQKKWRELLIWIIALRAKTGGQLRWCVMPH